MEASAKADLSSRSLKVGCCSMCGPHFYSMKITEDVRKFAIADKGAEVYAKA
jgi:thiamine biosynthesis protein ThiC